MVKMMKYIIIFLVLVLFGCCKKVDVWDDDKLSFSRRDYTSEKMKIDGYYYTEYTVNSIDYIQIYFLYKNGVVLYGSAFEKTVLPEKELNYQSQSWYSSVIKTKYRWGIFIVEDTSIQLERWYPTSGGGLPTYNFSGNILNDTTFHFNKSMRSDGSEMEVINQTYHFKQFSPKPDSVNNFIK